MTERMLPAGLAARLARYLQVLMQARKDGRATISSQALGEHSAINSTQVRRDLSGLGRFGKRGVGYDVEDLTGHIPEILGIRGQNNIALLGAGNLGTAIAGSGIFDGTWFQIAAIFDADPARIGQRIGELEVQRLSDVARIVTERNIIAGALAVPATAAQGAADVLIDAGVVILINYSEALVQVPPGVMVQPVSPAGGLFYNLYLLGSAFSLRSSNSQ